MAPIGASGNSDKLLVVILGHVDKKSYMGFGLCGVWSEPGLWAVWIMGYVVGGLGGLGGLEALEA
jgi:hypothetical protein